MGKLDGRVALVTGAGRGIGRAVAQLLADEGASLVINDLGTGLGGDGQDLSVAEQAAREIDATGERVIANSSSVTDFDAVGAMVQSAVDAFGGLDIVVNNASAISLTPVADTDMRRFDLMHQINARGTFMVSKYAVPHLARADNPHILMIAPPLDMREKWFAPHTAYSIAKFGMSLVALGLAGELRGQGIAVNALWPRTTIATAAVENLLGGKEMMRRSRTPDILADASHRIFLKPARSFTGHFLIDDSFLAGEGVTDFEQYRIDPAAPLQPDFFVPDDPPPPKGVRVSTE